MAAERRPGAAEQSCCWPRCAGVLRDSIGAAAFGAAPLQPAISLFAVLVGLSPDDPIWHPTTFKPRTAKRLSMTEYGALPGEAEWALQRSSPAAHAKRALFSDGTLCTACASHALAGADRRAGGTHTANAIRSWRGLWHSKAARSGQGGFSQTSAQQNKTHRSSVDPDALPGPAVQATPPKPSYRGQRAHGQPPVPDRELSASPKPQALRNGIRQGGMALTVPGCPPENPWCRPRTTTPRGYLVAEMRRIA